MELSINQLKKFTPNYKDVCILQYDIGHGREVTKFNEVEVVNEDNIVFLKCKTFKDVRRCLTICLKWDEILKVEVI